MKNTLKRVKYIGKFINIRTTYDTNNYYIKHNNDNTYYNNYYQAFNHN